MSSRTTAFARYGESLAGVIPFVSAPQLAQYIDRSAADSRVSVSN